MVEPREPDPSQPPAQQAPDSRRADGTPLPADLSSTLQYVRNVQQDDDTDTSWHNLHDKVVRWVAEAAHGSNLPADRSLDDLTQEVLLQVFHDIDQFQVEPGASFAGWVRTIAQRKLTDTWRRERAQKRGGGRQRHLGDFDEQGGQDRFADERAPHQSMFVRLGELGEALDRALAQLDEKYKRVIELRMFQGKSFAEIAPLLGYQKEVTVRSLHLRALEQLQSLLAPFRD